MTEASKIMELAAPFIKYVIPTLFIFSAASIAEHLFDFNARLLDWLRGRKVRL